MRSRHIFAFVIFSLLPCVCISAQSPNGTISGEVVDATGGVIVGADILAANDATGVQYSAKTNGEGIYLVPSLPAGTYRLQVSKTGFKTIVKPDILLSIEDALAINFTLPVGAVAEVVTVSAGVSILNTTDGSVSTVVDQNYVKNMPLNGRSFQDLILLTPGSVTQSPQNAASSALGMTGEISINGQRTESNYYAVDGVSANVGAAPGTQMLSGAGGSGSVATASALGTTQALVSVDDLEEFRIQSSTYSAEYGRNPGGQFTFETKSGTNLWHGTAYDYLRNGAVDANDWFNDYLGVKQADLRQNDFGGTLGGPLDVPSVYSGRDRTFFFISYEGLRLVEPQEASVNYVPDNAVRTAAPANLQPLLNAFPVANGPDQGNGIAEFISGWSNPGSLNSTSLRLDHVLNDRWRLFFRFSDTLSEIESRGSGNLQTPAMQKASTYTSRTYTGGLNSTIAGRFTNEFRVNYSSNQVVGQTSIGSFGGNTRVDLATISGLSQNSEVTAFLIYGGYQLGISQLRSWSTQRQWNIVDTANVVKGRQALKFGVDSRRLTPNSVPFSPLVEYIFQSESAVESNSALGVAANYQQVYPLFQNFSAFAEDEWKLSARLNLSMGLRWELDPAPGVTQGLKPYAVQGATPNAWTLAPEGTALWKTSFYNFAPRLSVAYVLRTASRSETVVRGGAGVFYDTGQQLGFAGVQGPGFSLIKVSSGAAFPMPASQADFPIPIPPVPPYSLVLAFPKHLELPYTAEWNAAIEQSLGDSEAVTVSYVGAHAARLLQTQEFSGSAIGNPNASAFIFYRNGQTSDYNALQIQFDRRLSRGVTALGSYTWSHCIDYGSQNYFLAYERGNCDFDVRNNFSGALSWDLPSVRQGRFLKAALNGWGLDDRFTARTSFPVTLSGSTKFDPTTGQEFYNGLNRVAGQPVYLYGSTCTSTLQTLGDLPAGKQCPAGRAINPLAFIAPSSGLGDAPRNFVRGFGAWQMDLAVRRDFSIYENLKLQFRAEAFNIFNHPNFGYVNPVFGQNRFGQSTGTLASTLGILSPLYQMGGPRSLQFAVKLIF